MPSLQRAFVQRETFDPTNAAHLESFDTFIKTGNWGDIQFYVELPYNEVPMTVLMKYVEHQRQVKRETEDARSQRFAARTNLVRMPANVSIAEQRKIRMAQAQETSARTMERIELDAQARN